MAKKRMNYAEKQRITLTIMQSIHLDHTDRRILDLLQTEPGINASEIGEKIGLSQSAVWRRIQSLREDGVIREQPVKLDREKVGLNTMVFAHVKLTSHGRSNLADFSEAVRKYPEVLDCYVLLGNVDFLLRIVTEDIKAYEQFFFEQLSQLPGIQEVNSSIVLSDIKHTTVLPI
jgi:Lrp/AsnC family transcriptional regulator